MPHWHQTIRSIHLLGDPIVTEMPSLNALLMPIMMICICAMNLIWNGRRLEATLPPAYRPDGAKRYLANKLAVTEGATGVVPPPTLGEHNDEIRAAAGRMWRRTGAAE